VYLMKRSSCTHSSCLKSDEVIFPIYCYSTGITLLCSKRN
jgi:hypothetical protein